MKENHFNLMFVVLSDFFCLQVRVRGHKLLKDCNGGRGPPLSPEDSCLGIELWELLIPTDVLFNTVNTNFNYS